MVEAKIKFNKDVYSKELHSLIQKMIEFKKELRPDSTTILNLFIEEYNKKYCKSSNIGSVLSLEGMFSNCINLNSIDLSSIEGSSVTSTIKMFYKCEKLSSLNMQNFKGSKVSSSAYMFQGCKNLKSINMQSFTGKMVSVQEMFEGCSSLETLEIPKMVTETVTSFANLFANCGKIQYRPS